MDQSAAAVQVAREGPILVVTIDRPQVRNAIDGSTAQQIADAMDVLDDDASLSVGILTGAGGTFCSGMDLKAFLRGESPEVPGRGFAGLTEAPPRKPLIAAIEGHALAGGCELALVCDLIVAARGARFGLPEVTRGLIAGSGGLVRLPQRIPPQIAAEYALTGGHFDAEQAHGWGMVNRLAEPGSALEAALELAREIARNAPLAVATTKRVLTAAPSWPADEVWARQRAELETILASSDAHEGAAAFAERREPRWTGR